MAVNKAVNLQAEQNVLGAMIENNEFCVEALGALVEEDFYSVAHKNIFLAIKSYEGIR